MAKSITKSQPPTRTPPRSQVLADYDRILTLLRDRVRTVAKRFQTGAYIVGRPGTGKTHAVRAVLEADKVDYLYLNGRVTPAAFFRYLSDHPDSILVIDDVSTLFDNLLAAQLLMAAVGGNPRQPRLVRYVTKNERHDLQYRGGVIAISNRPLRHDPAGAALSSRLATLEFEPTDEMIVAFLRARAAEGTSDLTSGECAEVCEFVIDACRSGEFRVDLRAYYKGLDDYRCWKLGVCETGWQELVRSLLRPAGAIEAAGEPLTRAETKAAEGEIVRELHTLNLDAAALAAAWAERTGKSMDTYYRRRRELRLG